jgi:hypothetical protein
MIEYKIEKPNSKKLSIERIKFLKENMYDIFYKNNLSKYSNEKYYSWDKIKFQQLPSELQNNEELYYIIKHFRLFINSNITTPILDKNLKPFFL